MLNSVNQADRPRLDGSLSEQAFATLVDQLRQRGGESGPRFGAFVVGEPRGFSRSVRQFDGKDARLRHGGIP